MQVGQSHVYGLSYTTKLTEVYSLYSKDGFVPISTPKWRSETTLPASGRIRHECLRTFFSEFWTSVLVLWLHNGPKLTLSKTDLVTQGCSQTSRFPLSSNKIVVRSNWRCNTVKVDPPVTQGKGNLLGPSTGSMTWLGTCSGQTHGYKVDESETRGVERTRVLEYPPTNKGFLPGLRDRKGHKCNNITSRHRGG